MPAKKIRFLRLIITGFLWAAIYLDTMDRICFSLAQFKPLNLNDWGLRIGDFLNNRWVINTGRDWGLLVLMISFIPVFFIGWVLVYHIRWSRLLPKFFRDRQTEMRPTQVNPVRKAFEPMKLRVQSSALLSVSPASSQIQNSTVPQDVSIPQVPNVSTPPTQPQYEDASEVQQILAMTAGIRADFFPHVLLDGAYASFAMSTEKQAVVVKIINRPESTFAVDTEIGIDESDWFYESGLINTPAKDIRAIAKNLQENEPDSLATPVILLMGGRLLNIDETLAYFEKNNIMLLRTDTAEGDEIPFLMDFLNEYFGSRMEG